MQLRGRDGGITMAIVMTIVDGERQRDGERYKCTKV